MSLSIRGKCNSCCVPGCNSNSTPSFRNRGGRITTFKLPRDETRRKEWIQAIPKRKYPPTVNHNVCILHFNEEDFSRNNRRIDLKKSAVPSIFPFVDGQRIDENADLCDEIWTEYVTYKKEAMDRASKDVDEDFPASGSDVTRILIERLRIPGSKYFGIGTAEITLQPDSDIESDPCEQKVTAKPTAPKKRIRRSIKSTDEGTRTSVESNDEIDMTHSPQATVDADNRSKPSESVHVQHCIGSVVNATVIPDNDEDKFGAMVSSKLLLMSPLQRLMSQKIISEILLKGQLGMLKNSLSPVLVSGYMKNASNSGEKSTAKNYVSTTGCPLPICDNSSSDKDGDYSECDPLMCQVKQETIPSAEFESFDFVKDDVCWSENDEDDEI